MVLQFRRIDEERRNIQGRSQGGRTGRTEGASYFSRAQMASLVRATGVEVHMDRHVHKSADNESSVQISVNDKGFCVYHPDIQLRKKTLLGGWETLLTSCPKCDEEFELKMQTERELKMQKLKEFELKMQKMELENMKIAAEAGLDMPAAEAEDGGGGGVEFPEAMVHWVAALELPESAASELLGFLCGDSMGMSSPKDFLDLEPAHIEAALSHVPVAKKKAFGRAVEGVKEDVLAAVPAIATVVDQATAAAEPNVVVERTGSGKFSPGWRQRPVTEAAEFAEEKARDAAKESSETAEQAHKIAAKWFGVKRITLKEGKYKGHCSGSTRNGLGQMKLNEANGSHLYEGEWENNSYHGHGVLTIPNGPVYEGEFIGGKKHGFGKLVWGDGKIYFGEFRQNRLEGFGIQYRANGHDIIHKGQWKDNQPTGALSIKRRDAGYDP